MWIYNKYVFSSSNFLNTGSIRTDVFIAKPLKTRLILFESRYTKKLNAYGKTTGLMVGDHNARFGEAPWSRENPIRQCSMKALRLLMNYFGYFSRLATYLRHYSFGELQRLPNDVHKSVLGNIFYFVVPAHSETGTTSCFAFQQEGHAENPWL